MSPDILVKEEFHEPKDEYVVDNTVKQNQMPPQNAYYTVDQTVNRTIPNPSINNIPNMPQTNMLNPNNINNNQTIPNMYPNNAWG